MFKKLFHNWSFYLFLALFLCLSGITMAFRDVASKPMKEMQVFFNGDFQAWRAGFLPQSLINEKIFNKPVSSQVLVKGLKDKRVNTCYNEKDWSLSLKNLYFKVNQNSQNDVIFDVKSAKKIQIDFAFEDIALEAELLFSWPAMKSSPCSGKSIQQTIRVNTDAMTLTDTLEYYHSLKTGITRFMSRGKSIELADLTLQDTLLEVLMEKPGFEAVQIKPQVAYIKNCGDERQCLKGILSESLKEELKSFFDWFEKRFNDSILKHQGQPNMELIDLNLKGERARVSLSWGHEWDDEASLPSCLKGWKTPEFSEFSFKDAFYTHDVSVTLSTQIFSKAIYQYFQRQALCLQIGDIQLRPGQSFDMEPSEENGSYYLKISIPLVGKRVSGKNYQHLAELKLKGQLKLNCEGQLAFILVAEKVTSRIKSLPLTLNQKQISLAGGVFAKSLQQILEKKLRANKTVMTLPLPMGLERPEQPQRLKIVGQTFNRSGLNLALDLKEESQTACLAAP